MESFPINFSRWKTRSRFVFLKKNAFPVLFLKKNMFPVRFFQRKIVSRFVFLKKNRFPVRFFQRKIVPGSLFQRKIVPGSYFQRKIVSDSFFLFPVHFFTNRISWILSNFCLNFPNLANFRFGWYDMGDKYFTMITWGENLLVILGKIRNHIAAGLIIQFKIYLYR